jgi:hypothetical protein
VWKTFTYILEEPVASIYRVPTMKMETAGFSKTLVNVYLATSHHIPENSNLLATVMRISSHELCSKLLYKAKLLWKHKPLKLQTALLNCAKKYLWEMNLKNVHSTICSKQKPVQLL